MTCDSGVLSEEHDPSVSLSLAVREKAPLGPFSRAPSRRPADLTLRRARALRQEVDPGGRPGATRSPHRRSSEVRSEVSCSGPALVLSL